MSLPSPTLAVSLVCQGRKYQSKHWALARALDFMILTGSPSRTSAQLGAYFQALRIGHPTGGYHPWIGRSVMDFTLGGPQLIWKYPMGGAGWALSSYLRLCRDLTPPPERQAARQRSRICCFCLSQCRHRNSAWARWRVRLSRVRVKTRIYRDATLMAGSPQSADIRVGAVG